LTRIRVDKDDDAPDLPELKECMSELILIKDDLKMFIPDPPNKPEE
jgi:hypothetical protein